MQAAVPMANGNKRVCATREGLNNHAPCLPLAAAAGMSQSSSPPVVDNYLQQLIQSRGAEQRKVCAHTKKD